MKSLIALQEFAYADVPLKSGDTFDASDEDARMLIGFSKAKESPRRRTLTVKTRELRSEAPSESGDAGLLDAGRYHRTDMRAED